MAVPGPMARIESTPDLIPGDDRASRGLENEAGYGNGKSSHAPGPEASMKMSRLKILLAEDNIINQKLAIKLLEKEGHDVVVANDGQEALERFDGSAFDLILMDVQMPGVDGLMATSMIRMREQATSGHTAIIALTAHAMKGDRERCLEAGMDGYITKPIDSKKLFNTISEVLLNLYENTKMLQSGG